MLLKHLSQLCHLGQERIAVLWDGPELVQESPGLLVVIPRPADQVRRLRVLLQHGKEMLLLQAGQKLQLLAQACEQLFAEPRPPHGRCRGAGQRVRWPDQAGFGQWFGWGSSFLAKLEGAIRTISGAEPCCADGTTRTSPSGERTSDRDTERDKLTHGTGASRQQ